MKVAKRFLGAILSFCVFLGSLVGTVACKETEDRIDYTITVTCEDEEVLAKVQVQLLLNGTAAAEAKGLNAEHKAVFNLEPKTYTVALSGADGYTYPETTVTEAAPNATVQLTAEIRETYSVTYSLGSCIGTDYAGSSTLPTETDKEEGTKFNLASAPVWNGYTFDGWSDGTRVYDAGEEYTMPAHAVTLTARWYDCPERLVKEKGVEVPEWNQDATTGGYRIDKGQYIQLRASFSGKSLDAGSDWVGIVSKIYKNCDSSVVGTFYQYRPDFAVDRTSWSWTESNAGFTVTDTN